MLQHFFSRLFEWFGLIPLYSKDLAEYLKGHDFTCTDYLGTPLYTYFGWMMMALTFMFYILQYYIIDSSRYNKREHWWFVALVNTILNFVISFVILGRIIDGRAY